MFLYYVGSWDDYTNIEYLLSVVEMPLGQSVEVYHSLRFQMGIRPMQASDNFSNFTVDIAVARHFQRLLLQPRDEGWI